MKFKLLMGIAPLLCSFILAGKLLNANKSIQGVAETSKIVKREFRIVFLVTEDSLNYDAHKTIPVFAEMIKNKYRYKVDVLLGHGSHGAYTYPNFEAISKADLLVIFARRIALPHEQMNILKNYLSEGKPLIGIRKANHAFAVQGKIADGFEDWPGFVADILGCQNRGYGPVDPGTV